MRSKVRFPSVLFGATLRPESAGLAILLMLLLLIFLLLFLALTAQPAQAQTYSVIHNFTGGLDGGSPYAGLAMDAAGNLYGTTCGSACSGTGNNPGSVFKLSNNGFGWVFSPLYTFRGGNDGANPEARVILGPDGSLYGTTINGGSAGYGTVFNLKPTVAVPPSTSGGWAETVLYNFQGGSDGANPESEVVFDSAGNLYGTTYAGGQYGAGTVFQLTPAGSGWTENVLYAFTNGSDGALPLGNLILDRAGNLYGTAVTGGVWGGYYGCGPGWACGTVFELTPSASGWTLQILYSFQAGSDGGNPIGGVVFGADGYLYGTTSWGGTQGGGTIFVLNHPWLGPYPLSGNTNEYYFPGPWDTLALDSAGSLYATTYLDGPQGQGTVFKISVSCGCGGCGWNYTLLHNFSGAADGGSPLGSVIVDANGTVYGTTMGGGTHGYGVVFAITQTQASKIAPAESSLCAKGQ